MLPETHPLIEAVTKPLGDDAEVRLSAVRVLEESFDPDHPAVPQMLERLEKRDKRKFPALGNIVIWAVALMVLTVAISADLRAFLIVAKIHDWEGLEDMDIPAVIRKLNQQELFLFGDSDESLLEHGQKLFESDRTNPAYFAEYVNGYLLVNKTLPPDFFETAERVDPGNSFFIYWAASVIGLESVERKRFTGPRPPDRMVDGVKLRALPRESEYTISDQADYEQALELLRKASEMPALRSYKSQMIKARAHFIPTDDFVDYESGYHSYYADISPGVDELLQVGVLLAAHAEKLSKSGQSEEFKVLSKRLELFLEKLASNQDSTILNEIFYHYLAYGTLPNFYAAAERLELKELQEDYRKKIDAFVAHDDMIQLRRKKGMDTFPVDRASPLGFSLGPNLTQFTVTVPALTDSYLRPMRLVEHELLGRFGILLVSLFLILGALTVSLFRFLSLKAVLLPAKRIAMLLKFSDWLWIICLGVALPIVVFLCISRLSPVSGRDYSCSHYDYAFPGIHLVTLLLTLLLAPAIVTRWRLTRRAAPFKLGSRLDLLGLPVVGVMLAYAIVAYPVLANIRLNQLAEFVFTLPLLGWLGFVFFNGLRIFLGSNRSRLIQSATAISVIPAYPLAILALCLTLPIYSKAVSQGLVEDKRIFIDPVTSELGSYEFKVAAQLHKEINTILGY